METKEQIRIRLKKEREQLPPEQRQQEAETIVKHLVKSTVFQKAHAIYCYYPMGVEVDLLPLAQIALELGIPAAFPKTSGERMDFYQIHSLSEFRKGKFGIMEPISGHKLTEPSPLVLVPGLGFQKQGQRIGYGKGYYDRYFMRYPNCMKAGIAYQLQIQEEIPEGNYDIPMELTVTAGGITRCRS